MKTLYISTLALALASPALADTSTEARRIELAITEKGFEPDKVTVKKGERVVLRFTRKTEKTCTKEVVVQLGDKQKIEKKLPLNTVVEIPVSFAKTGDLAFACGMDMNKGLIRVQ